VKRIARVLVAQGSDMEAVTRHAELVALLRTHFSPVTAALFAQPKLFEGGVEWYSDLGGQPVPFSSLSITEAARAHRQLQERLASIRQLADRLEQEGGAEKQTRAAMLRRAARDPDSATWYTLNGQPLLTVWGPEPAIVDPVPVADPPANASTVAAPLPPESMPIPPRRRGCFWPLLVLLLIALLAALLWWLFCPLAREPVVDAQAPDPIPTTVPCVKELPPELVLLFDASLSMEFSMNMDPAEASKLFYEGGAGDCFDADKRLRLEAAGRGHICTELTAPPQRMSVAKTAAQLVLRKLPAELSVGIVLIEDCPAARPVGFFSPAQRADLLRQIDAIHSVAGTPLADGVAKAGAMLDGVNRDAFMLVISDGEEACKQDPCAVALQLAATKPRLKINVVDIANVGAGNCLASATGGKVFMATQVDQVATRIQEALQDLMASANCVVPADANAPP